MGLFGEHKDHMGCGRMTLNARCAFSSEKKHDIGWSGACGRMTLNVRWAFFREKTNNIGWGGACGRMTLTARCAYLAKRQIILDGAPLVRNLNGRWYAISLQLC